MAGFQSRLVVAFLFVLLAPARILANDSTGAREVSTGPFTVGLHGGAQQDTGTVGIDGRFDWLRDPVNVHVFGTVELLDNGTRFGEIENRRFGSGLALSHTYGDRANAFVGSSFIRETGKTFGQIYLGGKLHVTDPLFVEGSYGFGFGSPKRIRRSASIDLMGEAVDWLKLGIVFVPTDRLQASTSVFVNDLWDRGIAGVDAKLAYFLTPNLSVGFRGDTDLSRRSRVERNWRSMAFVDFHFGGENGSLRRLALSTGDPVSYPKVIRRSKRRAASAPAGPTPMGVSLSPSYNDVPACSDQDVLIAASGGTPPYSWSIDTSSGGGLFTPDFGGDNSQALWNEDCIDDGYDIITVTDSAGGTAQSVMDSGSWYARGF